jgi:hypothetical protein
MNNKVLEILAKMELRPSESISEEAQNYIASLPLDYIEFMTIYNGAVGFIGGSNNYLDLWTLENVVQLNPYFPEEEFSKQVIIIGSNGSGSLYGYDLLDKCFFATDEYQMNREEIIKCGATFFELIKYLESNE